MGQFFSIFFVDVFMNGYLTLVKNHDRMISENKCRGIYR